jgi:ribosomal protein S28E/S33
MEQRWIARTIYGPVKEGEYLKIRTNKRTEGTLKGKVLQNL